jgi:hypothetical protein
MSGALSPLPPYVFMVQCLIKHKYNFIFIFTFSSVETFCSEDETAYLNIGVIYVLPLIFQYNRVFHKKGKTG